MVLFLMCTVFNMIIMLNLLIAIISDSYARVKAISSQATYQERCALLTENYYLIPEWKKKSYAEMRKYLLVVTDLEEDAKEDDDEVVVRLKGLKDQLDAQVKSIKKSSKKSKKTQSNIQDELKQH